VALASPDVPGWAQPVFLVGAIPAGGLLVTGTEPAWEIREGDCRDLLQELPDQSVSAVCTDPPYELGFMGRTWDSSGIAYDPRVWREVLRVLKPGAHLVAFGGTRTAHRLVSAIEDAGAEIRDSLIWLYGSGFPKSRDVGKALDSEAGAEREVVGVKMPPPDWDGWKKGFDADDFARQQDVEAFPGPCYGKGRRTGLGSPLTAPATEAAQQWDGWGTALKPGHEPICLARKPLEGTVAANVLAHCTGGINVDRCRVETGEILAQGAANPGFVPGSKWTGAQTEQHPAGRWPPNVLLTHSADCRRVGEREVERQLIDATANVRPSGFGSMQGSKAAGTSTETIPAYECAPDCPVAELGRQSGECGDFAGGYEKRGKRGPHAVYGKLRRMPCMGRADTGTAARFFPQFEWTEDDFWPFRYQAKASRAERDKGCRNTWPTVKPLELMRWLVRLVTPPGGLVLDPFLGSGPTLIAAGLEGFRGLGFEQDPEAIRIATARIRYCLGEGKAPPLSESADAPAPAAQRELFG
jgi:site-specific DNA-methyltransferase (adenine-specific)